MPTHPLSGKILWLASYPKSGNTWFRAFLTALMNEGKVDINAMKSDGLFSSRDLFDIYTDVNSRDLYDREVKLMQADVYRQIAKENDTLSIIKIHDFFGPDPQGQKLVPEDVTHCAIYFVRNPLDIAASLANHLDISIGEAVDMLNNDDAYLARQRDNFNKDNQLAQYISGWSNHVNSWTTGPSFPVCVVRYEDMLANTFETFSNMIRFAGWEYSAQQIAKAIESTNFDALSKQETEKGFNEGAKNFKFFRSGKMGNWKNELSRKQAEEIILKNKMKMKMYQYI